MESPWLALCPRAEQEVVLRVLHVLDEGATCEFLDEATALREAFWEYAPGEKGAILGLTRTGVSDVNLAAAIAADGRARQVVLVRRSPSGSLRSRAARAGIDLVVDPDDYCDMTSSGGAARVHSAWEQTDGGSAPGVNPRVAPHTTKAPVIGFFSGRGGVGKTTVVACAAALAASWGMHVEAVDLDLSCGNLFSALGCAHCLDLSKLDAGTLADADALFRLGVSAAEGIRVWGPCERPESAELAMPIVADLIDALAAMSELVLVDTSPTFTDAVAAAAQHCDRVVLVHDQRPGSLAPLARTSGLAVRLGVARTRIARLENRASPKSRPDPAFGRAEVGLETARAFRTVDGGAEVGEFMAAGEACELVELGSAFTDSLSSCLAQLLSELGALPECEAAQRAAHGRQRKRRLFGPRREAS